MLLRLDRATKPDRAPSPAWFELEAARILALIGALKMPSEIGGKKFVTDFKAMIETEVAKALDEGRSIIREATTDLKSAIKEQSHGVARVIREQAQHIRDEMGEYTGNNPQEEEEKTVDKLLDPTQQNAGGQAA